MLAGVDGCRAGWYAIIQSDAGELTWAIFPDIERLLAAVPEPGLIAIDVPIGLLQHGSRTCDILARQVLGPKRGPSVFAAPIRPVLSATSHASASAVRREVEGKGMSIQAFAIIPKVREVDSALRARPDHQPRVFEVHPEVTFAALNSGAPVDVSKKRAAGRRARIDLLRESFGDAPERFSAARPRDRVAADDVLDAFAALWSARRIRAGRHGSLPELPDRDALGIPMAISV